MAEGRHNFLFSQSVYSMRISIASLRTMFSPPSPLDEDEFVPRRTYILTKAVKRTNVELSQGEVSPLAQNDLEWCMSTTSKYCISRMVLNTFPSSLKFLKGGRGSENTASPKTS